MVRHASTVNMLQNWSIDTSNLSEKRLDDFTFEKMGAATLESRVAQFLNAPLPERWIRHFMQDDYVFTPWPPRSHSLQFFL